MNLYKKTKRVKLIQKILNDNLKFKKDFLVWFNDENIRHIVSATIDYMDAQEKTVQLNLKNNGNRSIFSPGQEIFFKGHGNNTIFKTIIKVAKENKLVVDLPEELLIKENRSDKRTRFPLVKKNKLIARKITPTGAMGYEFMFKLQDLSPSGVSLIAKSFQLYHLKIGDQIRINNIIETHLDKKIDAEIVWVKESSKQTGQITSGQHLIGLKFLNREN